MKRGYGGWLGSCAGVASRACSLSDVDYAANRVSFGCDVMRSCVLSDGAVLICGMAAALLAKIPLERVTVPPLRRENI